MAGILLWGPGLDELGRDAEPDPPRGQLRQARQGQAGKQRPSVTASALGKTILLPDQPLENPGGEPPSRVEQTLARQDIAAVGIDDRHSNTCTTGELGGAGTCIVLFPGLRKNVKFVSFSVTSVTLAGYTYVGTANHDPDGSSNGTTQRVNRP